MTERVGQKFGNYRLTRLLGKGGFASVYLAEHIHLHTLAAIKVLMAQLSSQEIESFRQEAYILARFNHPNIIRMLDFGVEEKDLLPFLIMQYAPHGTLRQRYPEGSCIPLNTVQLYVKSIAAALQYAHDHHIIHRDVKPENMLLDEQDEVLLSDFGLALLSQKNTLQSLQQQTQGTGGTSYYMAPEQIEGKARPASDQYALAVVVYEWLCGARPFEGTPIQVCLQHLETQPQPLREKLPTLSPAVEQVVMKALAKDPKQRFDSVQAFATAFAEAVEGKTTANNSDMQALATALEEATEEATTASDTGNILVTVPAEHMEEQGQAISRQQGYVYDQGQERDTKEQEQAIASHQGEPPRSDSSRSSSPPQNVLTPTKPVPVRRQTRKPRAWLVGIAALALFSLLVGSAAFAAFTLIYNTHNPVTAKAPSTTPTHAPAAKATATPPTTAHTPTATAAPTTPAQPTTAPAPPVHVTSSIDFTTQPPTQNGMVIDTNASQATFQANPNHLNLGSIVVDFTLQPQANTATLSLTGVESQIVANNPGFAPINIACNGQTIQSEFTAPGNWTTGNAPPGTATISLSGCLIQGNNQLQITLASGAKTVFWLYNLSVTQST